MIMGTRAGGDEAPESPVQSLTGGLTSGRLSDSYTRGRELTFSREAYKPQAPNLRSFG